MSPAPGPRPAVSQLHPSIHLNADYEKMVGPTRSKLREASPSPPQSSRSVQTRRRQGAGTAEAPSERGAQQERPKRSLLPPFFLSNRRNLPGGARNNPPRRIRNMNGQNYFHLEEATKLFLFGRFQFLHTLLDHFREKMQALQMHRFSHKTLFGVGEQSLLRVLQLGPGRMFLSAQRPEGFAWVLEIWSTRASARVDAQM